MSVAPKISEFMSNLSKELMEKKGVAESSATSYIRLMFTLNDKAAFKTLSFLRNKDAIMQKIKEYADSTQKTVLAAIVSVLSLYADKPTYKAIHRFYHEEMVKMINADREVNTSEKTEKQKTNWIDWKNVKELSLGPRTKLAEYANKKQLTASEAEHLLQNLILSLYVCIQPRRNQDYLNMMVVKKWTEVMPTDHNYLDITGERFIFNVYKTAKKYGTQIVPIPNDEANPLMNILVSYLKHHKLYKETKGKVGVPFLVTMDGKPLTAVNSITRILNKIFGKKVGSSMLRHIFLSDKYDIDEMQKDAAAMGHSLDEQKKYMKHDGVE